MSYRAIKFADVHLYNSLPHARRLKDDHPLSDRLDELARSMFSACAKARDMGIEDVWYLGDLIDRRLVDAVTWDVSHALLLRISRELGMRQWILPGNHEAADRQCSAYVVDALRHSDERIIVVRNERVEPVDGLPIWCFPYQPDARVAERLGALPNDAYVMLHQTVKGAAVGMWKAPVGLHPELLARFHTLAGHFHTEQEFPSPARGRYLGAPVQHSFEDADDIRSAWIVTYDKLGEAPKLSRFPIGGPRFIQKDVKATGKALIDLVDTLPDEAEGNYVKVRVEGTLAMLDQAKAVRAELESVLAGRARRFIWEERPSVERKQRLGAAQETKLTLPGNGELSAETYVGAYIDACDTTGLDIARLKQLGVDAMSRDLIFE